MKCTPIQLPGGGTAIVCGSQRKLPRCECGNAAPLLCDWITNPSLLIHGKPKTCDKPLCAKCTTSPAEGKDLCHEHAALWDAHPSNPKNVAEAKERSV